MSTHTYGTYYPHQLLHSQQQQQPQKSLGGFYCESQYHDNSTPSPQYPSQSFSQQQASWRNYEPQPQPQEYIPRTHNYSHYEHPPLLPTFQHRQSYEVLAPPPLFTSHSYNTTSTIHRLSEDEEEKPRRTSLPEISSPTSFIASPVLSHPSVPPLSPPPPPQTLGDLLKSRCVEMFQTSHPSRVDRLNVDEEAAVYGCLPFIAKLRGLLANEDSFSDVLRWDTTGTLFIVHHNSARLKSTILPDTYGHSNYPSFTRQLNIYGFRRLTASQLSPLLELPESHIHSITDFHGWIHPNFLRNAPNLSAELKPRTSFARRILKEEKERKEKVMRDREDRSRRGMKEGDSD